MVKKFKMRAGAIAVAVSCLTLHPATTPARAETLPAPKKMFAADMTWQPMAEGSPLKIVKLWGDHAKDADYGMLVKLPAGFSTGMHSHSSEYYTIELQGRKVHRFKDEEKSEAYTPGSFTYEIPGHVHEDVCLGPEECILFIHQRKSFDFIPEQK
ncbi:MAG: cupin domain-containing protein [Hyphomicrobium sp.]